MQSLNLFRKRAPSARYSGGRRLGLESLEQRTVLTAGALAVEAVELIGPAPAAAASPALIGPQTSAPAGASPLELAEGFAPGSGAQENSLAQFAEIGEGEGEAPVITAFYAVELFGWIWFEGSVADDAPVEGLTVSFSGVYGDFTAEVQSDGTFWSVPFMAEYGQVLANVQDFDLNRSETVELFF